MVRFLGIAWALLIGGFALAGCGGGGGVQNTARQEAKQLLGDGRPKLLRIETVQDAGGTREAVVTMEGHFKPQCSFGSCRAFSYAWLEFSLSNPNDLRGFSTTSASQLAAIDHAKSAKPLFKIFPDFTNPAIRCAIPRGSSGKTIAGGCVMLFEKTKGSTRITFRERWPFAKTRDGHWAHDEKTGGWIVTLDRTNHVQAVHAFGDVPPQLWK